MSLLFENVLNQARFGDAYASSDLNLAMVNESYIDLQEAYNDVAADFLSEDFANYLSEAATDQEKDAKATSFFGKVKEKIVAFWKKIVEIVGKIYNWIKTKLRQLVDWVKGLFGSTPKAEVEAELKQNKEDYALTGKHKPETLEKLVSAVNDGVNAAMKFNISSSRDEARRLLEEVDTKIAEFDKQKKASDASRNGKGVEVNLALASAYHKVAIGAEQTANVLEKVVEKYNAAVAKVLNKKDVTEAEKSLVNYAQSIANKVVSKVREISSLAMSHYQALSLIHI